MRDYCASLTQHYEDTWARRGEAGVWTRGPVTELPAEFHVLQFPPSRDRPTWTYATVCMSQPADDWKLELHLFSPIAAADQLELLTVVAHYHRTGARLALGHTVNIGRPWLPGSECTHLLVSRPYLDGPALEVLRWGPQTIWFLWLVPITKREVEFKKQHGLEALEQRLEAANFNYADPDRASVV